MRGNGGVNRCTAWDRLELRNRNHDASLFARRRGENTSVDTDRTTIWGSAMTNNDDQTFLVAIAIGAILVIIWAIRMAIIAFS
jgi:hypothetical protein